MINIAYQSPDGLPRLQCMECHQSSFIIHEAEPGKQYAVECSICRTKMAMGIAGHQSALRTIGGVDIADAEGVTQITIRDAHTAREILNGSDCPAPIILDQVRRSSISATDITSFGQSNHSIGTVNHQ